ncbi:hypothetical protein NADFUDRAFT_51633 [Nadsonia fulvescens var. elongata DSM 6958]|uniref:Protein BCP1 n=1 Tax=Nadsonia fulvescens var. elongata DSM 6958 TaxID=857566 RepID=A0A1E3PIK1_9ASCO|nr:hypothetical protein NADFUDRAFT_51633 [Nadsonia fulvescens var. elongata DSM 6958]
MAGNGNNIKESSDRLEKRKIEDTRSDDEDSYDEEEGSGYEYADELDDESSDDSGSDIEKNENGEDIVNVDFDFFDFEEIDYHAVNNLLRQLLDADAPLFELSGLADLILKQKVGTTIKTDGKESDPFAMLSVVNMKQHADLPVLTKLRDYFIDKVKTNLDFYKRLRKLFTSQNKSSVGLVLSERLINMPVEVIPPMYKMLQEELDIQAKEDNSFDFEYYLVLSKVFTEEISKLEDSDSDSEDERPRKKKVKQASSDQEYPFHTEDDILHTKATFYHTYTYDREGQEADSKRAFQENGIRPKGHLMLIKKEKFVELIADMEKAYPPY